MSAIFQGGPRGTSHSPSLGCSSGQEFRLAQQCPQGCESKAKLGEDHPSCQGFIERGVTEQARGEREKEAGLMGMWLEEELADERLLGRRVEAACGSSAMPDKHQGHGEQPAVGRQCISGYTSLGEKQEGISRLHQACPDRNLEPWAVGSYCPPHSFWPHPPPATWDPTP